MKECPFCRENHGKSTMILENEYAISTAVDYFREGHCCVIIKKHKTSISQLEPEESIAVFDLISKTSKVLEIKYKATKTYMLVIGDQVEHLHFHLIPKHDTLCSMGIYCFGKLFETEGERHTSIERKEKLAQELRSLVKK
jgi:diadenosine tetraphosphate (Ap4A) HIT family hydrolase